MFCPKCGEEIHDDAIICPKCGREVAVRKNEELDEAKTGVGVICGLFLGLIGLILGVVLYKEGSFARQTFLKGWAISFLIEIIAIVLIYVFVFATIFAAI